MVEIKICMGALTSNESCIFHFVSRTVPNGVSDFRSVSRPVQLEKQAENKQKTNKCTDPTRTFTPDDTSDTLPSYPSKWWLHAASAGRFCVGARLTVSANSFQVRTHHTRIPTFGIPPEKQTVMRELIVVASYLGP